MQDAQPTVAILGASADRAKFGNKSVRAHAMQGYRVYPINPKAGEIEGFKAYATLAETGLNSFDRISVYLPPAILLQELEAIANFQCRELWLNPGCDTPEIIAKAEALGLKPIAACSIVDLGVHPSDLD